MKDKYVREFDLILLLKSGDLDIRGIAAYNESLLVREYFATLSGFLDAAPAITAVLSETANSAGDENSLQRLQDISNVLAGIGYNKLSSAIEEMVDMRKKGNREFFVNCAKSILADFVRLCERIGSAQIKSETETIQDGEDAANNEGNSMSLKEVLEQADYEEENRKMRVLAVDDTAFMLKTITAVLGNNYEVFSLNKAILVEKFLRHTTPELFLLDYNMPELSGFDLVPLIRNFKEHRDTPIIFLTAMGTPEHVKSAVALGACDYVVKPIKADILLEKIEKHIVRKKAF